MTTEITNYQCPACTAPLHFVGESGRLECDYCGSSYEVAEIETLYAEKEKAAAEQQKKKEEEQKKADAEAAKHGWSEEERAKLKVYNCPSCGAELFCDETTAATSCPYCGNPTIIPGQFSGDRKPDYVIPFKLDKEAAKRALKNYYGKKFLLPKAFKNENHIEEIKGVYVPFWLFDCEVDGEMTFDARTVRTWREGDYQVTETNYFLVSRAGTMAFAKIPVDASTKMPDNHMDALEPFDYDDLTEFSTAYLPGFLADIYDVSAEDSASRIEQRATNSTHQAIQATVLGYNTAIPLSSHFDVRRKPPRYVLLPVWLLTTKWKGQNFLFAMNGQTGKLIGNLPVDWKKYWGLFAGITFPLTALLFLLTGFLS